MDPKHDKSKPAIEAEPTVEPAKPKVWLDDLLSLRLAGTHLADGIDPDEHIRELREGWDEPEATLIHTTSEVPQPRNHLEALLEARGIGIEMAKGIDLDEHLRQVREG